MDQLFKCLESLSPRVVYTNLLLYTQIWCSLNHFLVSINQESRIKFIKELNINENNKYARSLSLAKLKISFYGFNFFFNNYWK